MNNVNLGILFRGRSFTAGLFSEVLVGGVYTSFLTANSFTRGRKERSGNLLVYGARIAAIAGED
jgi:hypothetical protein